MDDWTALRERLLRATTLPEACAAAVDHLLAAGMTLASLYLERGGRLRCQAVRGYWQVFDGMPVDAGVIGATFRRGEPTEIRGVVGSADYLDASPGVRDEVCVPILAADRVVGALNVESPSSLPADALAVTSAVASAFAHRLVELGGVPEESPAQRLARHAPTITEAQQPAELWAAACAAARAVTGSTSAAVVLGGADEQPHHHLAYATGAVAGRLVRSASPEALRAVAGWVSSGSSCWTMEDPDGRGLPGSEVLRAAGAVGVLVVPLGPTCPALGGSGFLLVADERPVDLATDVVELLEMLGAHVTSCARNLAAMAALRRQASRDPLTELGHHAAYQAALTSALGSGPVERSIAVVLLDVDDFKSVNDRFGHPAGDALLRTAGRVLSAALRDGEQLYRIGGDEFATLLRVTTAAEALAVARRLHAAARAELGNTISVGIALAQPGEQPAAVVARADEALYEVKRSGRDDVRLAPAGGTSRSAARQGRLQVVGG